MVNGLKIRHRSYTLKHPSLLELYCHTTSLTSSSPSVSPCFSKKYCSISAWALEWDPPIMWFQSSGLVTMGILKSCSLSEAIYMSFMLHRFRTKERPYKATEFPIGVASSEQMIKYVYYQLVKRIIKNHFWRSKCFRWASSGAAAIGQTTNWWGWFPGWTSAPRFRSTSTQLFCSNG